MGGGGCGVCHSISPNCDRNISVELHLDRVELAIGVRLPLNCFEPRLLGIDVDRCPASCPRITMGHDEVAANGLFDERHVAPRGGIVTRLLEGHDLLDLGSVGWTWRRHSHRRTVHTGWHYSRLPA